MDAVTDLFAGGRAVREGREKAVKAAKIKQERENLENLIANAEGRRNHLQREIDAETQRASRIYATRPKSKEAVRIMRGVAARRKRMVPLDNTISKCDQLLNTMDQVDMQVAVASAMQTTGAAIRGNLQQMDPGAVADVMDDLQETIVDVTEVAAALSEPLDPNGETYDEDDALAELAAMRDADLEEQRGLATDQQLEALSNIVPAHTLLPVTQTTLITPGNNNGPDLGASPPPLLSTELSSSSTISLPASYRSNISVTTPPTATSPTYNTASTTTTTTSTSRRVLSLLAD